jgi:hypothetical protein
MWFRPTRLPARSGCDGTHDNPLEFGIEEIDQVELTWGSVEHLEARAVVPELRADCGLLEASGWQQCQLTDFGDLVRGGELVDLAPKTVYITGRQEPASKHTKRRLARYRTGEEGRISHLKRRYGLDRSRLKGD